MFARVLYIDEEKALELEWFGFGALQVRFRNGDVRRAHPFQKSILISISTHFLNAGQPLHPSNPRCSKMMADFAEMLQQSPNSMQWQVMLQSDLKEVGESYAAG